MRDFHLDVPQSVLDDLQLRLAGVRWPPAIDGAAWERGTDADYLKHLVEYWRTQYDWRAHEAAINDLDHLIVDVEVDSWPSGYALHAVVQQSVEPDAPALLLLHGWPDSFLRYSKALPLLADFHVVVPSIPGYGFSEVPTRAGMTYPVMADLMAELMAQLGHDRFLVSGGDIGTGIADRLGRRHPHRLTGIHLTDVPTSRFLRTDQRSWSTVEHDYADRTRRWRDAEGGYQHLQSTKPMTAAYGLTDSPVGLAAWIVEKLRSWSDCHGDLSTRFTADEVITFLMVYWFGDTIASSFGPYFETDPDDIAIDRVTVPTAISQFPADLVPSPREIAERLFDLRRWTELPRGGHFGAFEEPELFTSEVRAFAAELGEEPSPRGPVITAR